MKTDNRRTRRLEHGRLAATIASLLGTAVTGTTLAQQQPPNEPAEEIVVTGSFIERPADRPQPVTVLTGAEISLSQRQSLAETFKDMPQVQATSAIVNGNENFVSPTTNVNLRGLGARATLVLMNGRRQTVDGSPGLDGVVSVDINNLAPSIMVDRIEVLTDGASALYGSDAVAGVVNLITRNNFEGVEFKTEVQSINEISSKDYTFGALFGTQSDDTSVVAGFEWHSQERMNSEDRYSEERLENFGLSTTFSNPGSFRPVSVNPTTGAITNLGPNVPDPLCGTDTIKGGLAAGWVAPLPGPPGTGPGCYMSLSLGRAIVPESTQANGLAVATHDFSDDLTAQVELGFARARYSYDFGYGLPITGAPIVLPGSHPGVAAAGFDTSVDYALRYRIRSPLGDAPTDTRAEQDTYRFAGSLDGLFGDSGWGWTATTTFSVNNSRNIGGDTIYDRFVDAVQGLGGPECGPGGVPGVGDCFWYNPFANRFLAEPGDPHYNDPILSDWVFARSNTEGEAELMTYDFIVTGELGELAGGTTGLAVGVQRREQSFFLDFDPITETGGYAFNSTPQQDYGGVRETDALFAELVMYPSDTVEIQFAARYEDYGSVDSTDPKIGFLWTPTESLFIRATAGTSFRQPGEVQSFGTASQGGGAWFGVATNARGLLQGNLNLLPEESENFTLGFTWDVTDNFTMDLNYFDIDFENLIVTEDGTLILENDAADGSITDPRIILAPGAPNEVCEVTGNVGAQCISIDDIALLVLSYVNQDFMRTSGIDFNFDWRFGNDVNEWGIGLNGTYVDKYTLTSEGQVFEGAGSYNATNFGYPNADLHANLRFDWSRDDHHARATVRHISALRNDQFPLNPGTEEKNFQMLDLLYEYTLPSGRGTITGAVLNATDEEDPIRQGDLRTTTSFVYDLRGRMYRVGFNWNF